MQLLALDAEKKLVFANRATKQQDYFCIECQQTVRVRGGPHRHNHYYHFNQTSSCRQSAKTMAHLQTQLYLYHLFPAGKCSLEMRFPEINRVADVVWMSQKLIFEIQYSPITAAEVQARNRDYASQGFQVIWILHDKRYNRWLFTGAEQWLRSHPHYYTNINGDGQGIIYDQFDILHKGKRKHVQQRLTVNMHQPLKLYENQKKARNLPKGILHRMHHWPVFFGGDLLDLCVQRNAEIDAQEYIEKAFAAEATLEEKCTQAGLLKRLVWHAIVRPYRLLFQILLERACK